jgi:hypothetical protein
MLCIRNWHSRPAGRCTTHDPDLGKRPVQAVDSVLSAPAASVTGRTHIGAVCPKFTAYAYS